ncbi:hypothetical protein A2706_01735 [Candidatus Peribacteria bacterium RIFCSPHIGHO2_01_FULL_51_35]|nr:MAG: hypothetical protein A2706_01735 [Candidatus Peribacteria bacterium RIFCSPHIGHO2_01_FULL_51_35]
MARSAKNANSSLVPHARYSLLKQRVFYAPLRQVARRKFFKAAIRIALARERFPILSTGAS